MSALFPLQPGGAASELTDGLGPHAALSIRDLTPMPRYGIKGAGSAAWFAGQGVALPPVNRLAQHDDTTFLRLGTNDLVCLADGDNEGLTRLRRSWHDAAAPKGYWSWREESWAWLRLGGAALEGALQRLCAVDLRAQSFRQQDVAQTRFAHVDEVVFRCEAGFDILFDITLTAQVLAAIEVARHAAEQGEAS